MSDHSPHRRDWQHLFSDPITRKLQAEVIKLAVGTLAPNLVEWSGAKFGQITKLLASPAPTGTKVIDRTLVVVKSYDKITFSLNH